VKNKKGLTRRQKVFLAEYLRCWNATAAAREAGYAYPNSQAWAILLNLVASGYLREAMKKLDMTQNEVLARLAAITRGNVCDFIDRRGRVVLKAVKDHGYAVKKVTRNRDGSCSVELHDPLRALEIIGKALGMFSERTDNRGNDLQGRSALEAPQGEAGRPTAARASRRAEAVETACVIRPLRVAEKGRAVG
jgi:phage terminase small subunit